MGEEKKDTTPVPKKKSIFRRILKVILYIVLGIIGLNVILYILLSIPAVQQQVVNFAIKQIKPIVNTEISIDKVRLSLFNNINLQGVYVESQTQDTLLYAKDLDVKFNIWKLFDNKLEIKSIDLDKVLINVSQETPDSPFNFQFLIDAFAGDTTVQDTTSSSLRIAINKISITGSRINYDILSEPETPGILNPSHISIINLNTELSLASIEITDLDAAIKSLSFTEKSGLAVNNLEAKLRSKGVNIWSEKLELSLPNSSLVIDSLKYNILTNSFLLKGDISLSPKDMLYIMPDLGKLDNNITFLTHVSGKLPSINLNNLEMNYGEDVTVKANAAISDYEHYDKSSFALNIEKFKITPKAITQFAQIADSAFIAPDMLSAIEYFKLKGNAEGKLNDLKIDIEGWTNQGTILLSSKASIADTTFQNFNATANLQVRNFNLRPFVGNEAGLGRLTMHTNLVASSRNGNISADVRGAIDALQHDSVTLKDIRFAANYNPQKIKAMLNADIPVGKLIAEASMTQSKTPQIEFDIDLHNLLVDRFYQNPQWKNPKLSLCLTGNLKGNSIDNIEGLVVLDSLKLWGDNFNYEPGKMTIESGVGSDNNRYINLKSFLLDANINGKYQFMTLADEISNIAARSLPGIIKENKRIRKNNNDFNLDILIHNTEQLGKIIELPATVIQPISIHAEINTIADKIKMEADIPHVKAGDMDIKNTKIGISNKEYALNLTAQTLLPDIVGDIILNLDSEILSDTIHSVFKFKNEKSELAINGELRAAAHFDLTKQGDLHSYLQFESTPMNVDELRLFFLPARITNIGNRTTIENFGFNVGTGRMFSRYFGVDGAISDQKQDTLNISFFNARLGDILRTFDINNISTTINGDIKLSNLLDTPEFYTDNLNLADIMVFGDTLGTFNIKSNWDNANEAINLDMSLVNPKHSTNSTIKGQVYPKKETLDLGINIDRFSLKWLEPFMAGMLSRMDGSVSSKINIQGKMDSPQADGWLGFNDLYVGVDYTNVTYHISDTIRVLPDKIGFRNLTIEDNNKNKAVASALISHNNFKDMKFQMNLDLDNFMVLNTESRTDSLFYGKVMASGNAQITGNENDIKVKMKIRNDKNSSMFITIPDISEASEYSSVVFINVPKQDSAFIEPVKENPLPLNLAVDLEVTPEINLAVIMNSSTSLDMRMKGGGLVKFSYDMPTENMRTYGDYIISSGKVRIRPQNIKTLEFNIREGSKVTLVGDPMNSSFDITAYYRVNARLSTLDASFSQERVPVNCVLGIKGNMNKMDLTYDVELPEADDDEKQKVKSLINTDEQKTIQFGNLILFGSFRSSTGISEDSGNMLGSIASSTLTGGLNALFGNLLGNNWEIGTNIETKDGSFSDADVSVNVSTRLFDDRLKLSTNVGYTNEASTSEFVGDFDVEYQLSKSVNLKAYSHTNSRIYDQSKAPTTQGIGIVYTREARTLKQLFNFFGKKNKSEK
ncbi:MAG: translocation/assembly module TamB domain-containing protein [Dysgonomonas sp.]